MSAITPTFSLTTALLRDITKLYTDADDYNVIINVGKGSDTQPFKAHSVILRARSAYFHTALSSKWAKRDNDLIVFDKPNISPKIFKIILKYIYTGTCNLFETGIQEFSLDLLLAADELALFDLVTHIQSHIITSERPWLLKNLIKVYQFSELTDNFSKLRDHCQEIIDKTPDLVFGSNDFANLDLSTLILLLKRDDLSVKEIDIWNHVIDWGIGQHPPLNPDSSIWTADDFETLKFRVHQALIHIRFFNISYNDHRSKISPFKNILSNQLYERLQDHHITFGSELISSRQAALITCWIEEREFSFEKVRKNHYLHYKLRLLMRGSRDGMRVSDFHRICDDTGPTVVVIKIRESNCRRNTIIGGYNPLCWTSKTEVLATNRSFIFSMDNDDNNLKNSILSRVSPAGCAIFNHGYGADKIGFGRDLMWFNGTSLHSDYEKNIFMPDNFNMVRFYEKNFFRPDTFDMMDFEVFQVIKMDEVFTYN